MSAYPVEMRGVRLTAEQRAELRRAVDEKRRELTGTCLVGEPVSEWKETFVRLMLAMPDPDEVTIDLLAHVANVARWVVGRRGR